MFCVNFFVYYSGIYGGNPCSQLMKRLSAVECASQPLAAEKPFQISQLPDANRIISS